MGFGGEVVSASQIGVCVPVRLLRHMSVCGEGVPGLQNGGRFGLPGQFRRFSRRRPGFPESSWQQRGSETVPAKPKPSRNQVGARKSPGSPSSERKIIEIDGVGRSFFH